VTSYNAHLEDLKRFLVPTLVFKIDTQSNSCIAITLFSRTAAHLPGNIRRDVNRRQYIPYSVLSLGTALIGRLAKIAQ